MVFTFYESIQGQRFEVIPRLARILFFDSRPFPTPSAVTWTLGLGLLKGSKLPSSQTPGAEAMISGEFVQFLVPQNSIPS